VVGRRGENFGVEKRWKKIKKSEQGGWDFCSSGKRPQRAHPQLLHWWLLIHSSHNTIPPYQVKPKLNQNQMESGFIIYPFILPTYQIKCLKMPNFSIKI
jgi:hypothetical protein